MLEKFIDKSNLTPEHVDMAYSKIKEYCDQENLDILTFIKDEDNIPIVAKKIQSQLPMAIRLVVKPKHIEEAIHNNLDFIIQTITQKHELENPVKIVEKPKKPKAKPKSKA